MYIVLTWCYIIFMPQIIYIIIYTYILYIYISIDTLKKIAALKHSRSEKEKRNSFQLTLLLATVFKVI